MVWIVSDYVHLLDGRLRIKVREVKGAPRAARRVEDRLVALPGVSAVDANPVTGNVLVLYDPARVGPPELLDALRDAGCLRMNPPAARAGGVPFADLASELARASLELAVKQLVGALL